MAGLTRLDASFQPVAAPSYDGGGSVTDYFQSIAAIRKARKAGRLSVLYVYDSSDNAAALTAFEESLFKNEPVAIALKAFALFKLDVSKDGVARDLLRGETPCIRVYDCSGARVATATFANYKPKASDAIQALRRAARNHGAMRLATFVKRYRGFLTRLDKIEAKKKLLADRFARAAGRAAKLRKLERERQRLEKQAATILADERRILAAVRSRPAEPTTAK